MNHHDITRPAGGRPPADHAIALMGCLGGTITFATVTVIALATGTRPLWLMIVGPIGAVVLAFAAWRAWRLVAIHGYYHEQTDDEDEDGSHEGGGGSGVRYPPDAPDGGGSLEFDWDGFVTGFWDHVDATSRDTGREPSLS